MPHSLIESALSRSRAERPRAGEPPPPQRAGRPHWAGPLLALVVFALVAYLLHRELAHLHVRNVLAQLHALPRGALETAFALTAGSYAALCGYDMLALRYLRKWVPWARILSASFIANAFGHNLGFGAFTGGAFRLRLYASSRLTATEVALVTGYTSVTTVLGLAVLTGVSFLANPSRPAAALRIPQAGCLAAGCALLVAVAAYAAWSGSQRLRLEIRGWLLRPPGAALGAAQILLGTLDLGCTAAVLWALLPQSAAIGYVSFAGLFAVAIAAGLITHLPGGIGAFEAVIVFALPQVPLDALLGSLLAYRLVYFLAPLLVATLLFGTEELWAQRARLAQARRQAAAFVAPAVPSIVGALTFIAGAVLLASGATPEIDTRLAPLEGLLPLAVVELSHLAGSIIGLALLVLARALFRRIRTAFHITFWLLVAGGAASLLKGFDYEEAIMLGVVLVVLALGRGGFYRRASIREQRFTPTWVVSVVGVVAASVWIGLTAYRHVEYSSDLWWTFAFDANAPRMLRASLVVSILAAAFLLLNLLRPSARRPSRGAGPGTEQIRRVIACSSSTLACAALAGDKRLLFSDTGESFIMYQVQGRSWIVLGDPMGPRHEAEELVWRFHELADRHGGRVVFFQTGAECLTLYVDLGLAALKLGEEARVPLEAFGLAGETAHELERARCAAGLERATFEVLPPERVPAMLPALRAISDAWLARHGAVQKRFSAGSFSEAYLRHFPLALVRLQDEPVAFANLWLTAAREEIAADVLRFAPQAPPWTMDYLFFELMGWARAEGIRWFNLGVAPPAGLEHDPLAPAWRRIGPRVFRHGEHFGDFESLRRYKAKFLPVWESSYLVARGGMALPLVLIDVSALIAGGLKELIA
ncbi:MAG TPA: bifunctional lysylphosphatidylglycerol flippase/synthetase MprF [Steroidobacteraceae bacterium]|nr:bifunctional lysylphosphatidylglycerol flippase/synthetase MprF [Steroidobacteraceae bacterium]